MELMSRDENEYWFDNSFHTQMTRITISIIDHKRGYTLFAKNNAGNGLIDMVLRK